MATPLSEVVSEVVAFARLKQQPYADLAETNGVLRSAQIFYNTLQNSDSYESRVKDHRAIVQDIVSRRRAALHSAAATPSARGEVCDGRVLATDLTSTMYDGVAGELTGGYFDHADAPPPETWLAIRGESEESPDFNRRVYLLSWVPQADVERVKTGIESTPSGCLSWVEDWRSVVVDS